MSARARICARAQLEKAWLPASYILPVLSRCRAITWTYFLRYVLYIIESVDSICRDGTETLSIARYPAYRYAREVELCTKVSRFICVATHSKNKGSGLPHFAIVKKKVELV